MSLLRSIKKGVKYFAMAFETQTLTEPVILQLIREHKSSKALQWMLTGERYYAVENDLLQMERPYRKSYQADHRLIHATYKNIVDEKIGYVFSKNAAITAETEAGARQIIDTLGTGFHYQLETLGFEASNKGIGWARPYIGRNQKFALFVPPSEQIIPGWKDATHTELDYVIRYYTTKVWRFDRRVEVTNVEVWTADQVSYYRIDGSSLLRLEDEEGHFYQDGEPETWGKVPWIPFKNNRNELPDIKFIKSLIDDYDLTRSEVANYIEEVKNLIFVLKGYSGDSLDEFLEHIYRNRAIILDADDDFKSDVETLTPKMDVDVSKTHYEQLKRDILEGAQAVNRDLDKFGAAPSGVALEFLFSGLELKSNQIESEFRRGFEAVVDFAYDYLERLNRNVKRETVSIVFNHDMAKDEKAIIESCNESRGLVSQDTILANHPWVVDVQKEKELLAVEKEESAVFQAIPPLPVSDDEES